MHWLDDPRETFSAFLFRVFVAQAIYIQSLDEQQIASSDRF